jgi:hypothetical protein
LKREEVKNIAEELVKVEGHRRRKRHFTADSGGGRGRGRE